MFGVVAKSTDGASWAGLRPAPTPRGFDDTVLLASLAGANRTAAVPGGLMTLCGPKAGETACLHDDIRGAMHMPLPFDPGPTDIGMIAWSGSLLMIATDGYCVTAPLYDYTSGSEFIVPDIRPLGGINPAPYYIRAS